MPPLSKIPISFASPSLGMNPSHTLPLKLKAAADAGFQGVEIGMDDLISYTRALNPSLPPPHPRYHPSGAPAGDPDPLSPLDAPIWTALLSASTAVRDMCASLNLHILCLQPFSQYEGWTPGTERARWTWAKAERWVGLAQALGAEMMQVGSNNELESSGDLEAVAGDMRRLAEYAGERGVKIAYEPWCWGAHVNTWEGCWEVVRRADHPNLGLCLDTFQISASPIYGASPTSRTGWPPTYTPSYLSTSLSKLTLVPSSKIFFLQISDGARLDPPLGEGSKLDGLWKRGEGVMERQAWSAGGRPLPFAPGKGGYLPVVEVTEAVLRTGFRGWLSYEIFEIEQQADDPTIPERYAQEGKRAHEKLIAAVERTWRRI